MTRKRGQAATFARTATPPYMQTGKEVAPATARRRFAAIEFAFVLPILVVMWLAGVEVTQLMGVNRKVDTMTAVAGELTAGSTTLSLSDVEGILDVAFAALYPLDASTSSMVLTAITIDKDGRAVVAWSRGRGGAPTYREGAVINLVVDTASTPAGSQLIMAEADYPYQPAVGYMLTGLFSIGERKFFTPTGGPVRLCDDTLSDCR